MSSPHTFLLSCSLSSPKNCLLMSSCMSRNVDSSLCVCELSYVCLEGTWPPWPPKPFETVQQTWVGSSVDRKSPALASGLLVLLVWHSVTSASSRLEVFPDTPWWLQCCRILQRRQGTGRLWAVHETLFQETQNLSQRLASCHPCLESLVFSLQSVDKQNECTNN